MTILQALFGALSHGNPPGNRTMTVGKDASNSVYGYNNGASNVPGVTGNYGTVSNAVIGAFTIRTIAFAGNAVYLDFATDPANGTQFSLYVPELQATPIVVTFNTAVGYAGPAIVNGAGDFGAFQNGKSITWSITQP